MEFPTPAALELHANTIHYKGAPVNPARSVRAGRLLAWGALGGILGGFGLAGVMALTGQVLGLPVTMLGVIGQAMFGLSASTDAAIGAGLGLHLFSSVLIGIALTAVLVGISRYSEWFSRAFFPATRGRVVSAGVLGGFLVFLVFGLPLLLGVLAPTMHTILTNMMVMMGASPSMASSQATAKLSGMLPNITTGFFVGHLVYGLLLAIVVHVGVRLQLRATGADAIARSTRESAA